MLLRREVVRRAEAVHPAGAACHARRCVVLFDAATGLPVRFEARDGPDGDELTECYSYVGLRIDGGLPPAAFDR